MDFAPPADRDRVWFCIMLVWKSSLNQLVFLRSAALKYAKRPSSVLDTKGCPLLPRTFISSYIRPTTPLVRAVTK